MNLAIPVRERSMTLALMKPAIATAPASLAAHTQAVSEDMLVERICTSWSGLIRSTIETGEQLIELKRQVGHGRWCELVNGDRIPFGERTAQKLVAIAAHPVLSNPTRASVLPAGWSMLAELSQVDADTLSEAMNSGLITPTMSRQDVRSLARRLRYGQSGGAPAPRPLSPHDEIPPEPTVEDRAHTSNAAAIISASTGVPLADIMSETRGGPEAALARHLLAYILRVEYNWTTVRVGAAMNRDRTTVAHSCDVITDVREEHHEVDEWIISLKSVIAHMQTLHDERPPQLRVQSEAA